MLRMILLLRVRPLTVSRTWLMAARSAFVQVFFLRGHALACGTVAGVKMRALYTVNEPSCRIGDAAYYTGGTRTFCVHDPALEVRLSDRVAGGRYLGHETLPSLFSAGLT